MKVFNCWFLQNTGLVESATVTFVWFFLMLNCLGGGTLLLWWWHIVIMMVTHCYWTCVFAVFYFKDLLKVMQLFTSRSSVPCWAFSLQKWTLYS